MKHAPQINMGIIVIALFTVVYTISQTLLYKPIVLSRNVIGELQISVQDSTERTIPEKGSLPSQMLKLKSKISKVQSGFRSSESATVSDSRDVKPITKVSSTQLAGKDQLKNVSSPKEPTVSKTGSGLISKKSNNLREGTQLNRIPNKSKTGLVASGNDKRHSSPGRSFSSAAQGNATNGKRRSTLPLTPPPSRSSNRR